MHEHEHNTHTKLKKQHVKLEFLVINVENL